MSKMSSINYTTDTKGQTKITTIIWTIEKFKLLLNSKSTREIRIDKSEDTSLDEFDPRFQLKMQFLGGNNDIIDFYYLSPNPVLIESTLSICRPTYGNQSLIGINNGYYNVQANKWQYIATLIKDNIDFSDNLHHDGSLRLNFQFKVLNDLKIDRYHIPEAQLSNDFENLLNNGMFTDITMKSAEMVEYKVHKVVLASRCTVLKAHFEHNTTECYTNIVESPLESDVLREVLTFIYSDKAPKVDEIPEKLLAAADYYQLSKLKSLCEEALHKKLTVENAIETLQLADLHSANTLKQLTFEFINDGQARLITKTEGWAKVKSVELIKRICESIVADDTDADI